MFRLIRAEVLKIRTTSTWWLFLAAIVVITAWGLLTTGVSHHQALQPHLAGLGPAARAQAVASATAAHTPASLTGTAASMLTAGQVLGVLFAMVLGLLVMTNEFSHQTAAATFLTTPRRTAVIVAKLVAAASFGAACWLVSTVIDAAVTPVYLQTQGLHVSLTEWPVARSVLLGLLAYVLWAAFGLGLGTIIRSQLGGIAAGLAIYVLGFAVTEGIFHLLYDVYRHGWVLGAPVLAPAVASLVMTTPGQAFAHAPPQWAGLLVMIGYVAALTSTGVVVNRRRDVP